MSIKQTVAYLSAGAVLFFVPLAVEGYYLYVLLLTLIFYMAGLGMNILYGWAGQISLGHAGFFAIGAYATALLSNYDVPFILSLVASGIVCALIGILMALPALRLSGFYLAIATLAFGVVIQKVIYIWDGLTGGGSGLDVVKASIGPFILRDEQTYYYPVICITLLFTFISRNLINGQIGRSFLAVREDEVAAQALGVNIVRAKIIAFGLSAFYTGIAGGLFAHLGFYINIQSFDLTMSLTFLVIVVVGGTGSIFGAFLGSAFWIYLPESFRFFKDFQAIVFGVSVWATIAFFPSGMAGMFFWVKKSLCKFLQTSGTGTER